MLNAKRRENDFIYAYSGRSIMSTFKKYPLVRRGAVSALAGYPVSGYRHKKKMPKVGINYEYYLYNYIT